MYKIVTVHPMNDLEEADSIIIVERQWTSEFMKKLLHLLSGTFHLSILTLHQLWNQRVLFKNLKKSMTLFACK